MSPDPAPSLAADAADATPAFLDGGGEMGALMRSHDWTGSSLGVPARWPQPLRTVVRLMLNSGHPMYIWWGPDLACLYNDAFRESIGPERHPASLGRPGREVWREIWPIIGPQIDQVMSGGGPTWHENHLVPITRHGRREDVFWTYGYSPIDDATQSSSVGGVLVVCTETTEQVIAARRTASERDRLAQLFEQAPTFMALLRGPEHRFEIANPRYLRLVGQRPILGKTFAQALPEAVEQGYLTLLDQAYASGRAYNATDARYLLQGVAGEPPVERFLDFVLQPLRDADGAVVGIFVQGVDITDRALARAALRHSETNFRSALRAGRMGSWETNFETMARIWSPEGMALFGLTLAAGRGRVGGAGDEYLAALHPDDRHIVEQLHALADRQDSFVAEYRIVRPDGTMLWLSGHGLVVSRKPDGRALLLVSIMADATERKMAEQALRVERERLALALASGQMGTYDLDIREDVLWWSPQTYVLFGVDPQRFRPSRASVDMLVDVADRDAFLKLRAQAILERRPFSFEFRVRRAGAEEAWLGLRGQADYDEQGRPVRSFGVIMDVSERKRAEQTLREADAAKDMFIATLAHELRNPLAPIRNAVELLKAFPSPHPQVLQAHAVIDRQARQMARLLDDLLDVSRMSQNRLQLRSESLLVQAVVENSIEIAQPFIDAGAHTLNIDVAEPALKVEGDALRLGQVFSNLLINAAKYTLPGGHINVCIERQADQAVVKVTDTGIGLAAEHISTIFAMFSQAGPGRHAQGGQGIGLALAKGLVELHGGTISARSEGLGRGSEFEVRLGLETAPLPVPEPAQAQAHAPEAHAARSRTLRVLIADDLVDIADSLAALLQMLGHDVQVVYDGHRALEVAALWRPDAAILDIGMPGMTGFEVCRRIRELPGGSDMVIVAQTGWGQHEDRRRTAEAGFDHHMVKPVDVDALVALISRRRPGAADADHPA